jgi:hypothetical protein
VTPEAMTQRRKAIEAMRDELAQDFRLSRAALDYWTEWLVEGYSGVMPPSARALGNWIERLDDAAGEHINFVGFPFGWDPEHDGDDDDADDDEGGAA